MLVQPWVPRVIAVPQYSQVITISPNLGEIGAPQVGHFNDVTPEGAITGEAEATAGLGVVNVVLAPHFGQNAASSGI
jgi:hypothetical protein